MKLQKNQRSDGSVLVANFLSAVTNIVTAQTAQYAAEQSELETIRTLETLQAGNGVYITPEDIPADLKDRLVQGSLDAHLKKAQSDQISTAAMDQMQTLEMQTKKDFQGKKVVVRIIDHAAKPLESVWLDEKSGQYKTQVMKTNFVKGVIEEIRLNQNLLVLRPTFATRLAWPKQRNFFVYVINPETLQPTVSISAI